MVPRVESAAEAEAAVAACRYPPEGIRGVVRGPRHPHHSLVTRADRVLELVGGTLRATTGPAA